MSNLVFNKQYQKKFEVMEKMEAGIVLIGSEAKNIRCGHGHFSNSYVKIFYNQKKEPEAWLISFVIKDIEKSDRSIKLLLHQSEIKRLIGKIQAKNFSLIPIRIYNKKGRLKAELALARGKLQKDRKEEIKKRDVERQLRRGEFYSD